MGRAGFFVTASLRAIWAAPRRHQGGLVHVESGACSVLTVRVQAEQYCMTCPADFNGGFGFRDCFMMAFLI